MAHSENINFISLGLGALAVTHRPKITSIPKLQAAGATHLATILSAKEGAADIGKAAYKIGLEWIWIDLANGQQPATERHQELAKALASLTSLISEGARLVIHCSAGIHRTGMIAYALLRTCCLDEEQASQALRQLRPVTADGVGENRLEWANDLAALARQQQSA